jgi:hypothetical protein
MFIGSVADAANAALYFSDDKYGNTIEHLVYMVPFVKWVKLGAKVIGRPLLKILSKNKAAKQAISDLVSNGDKVLKFIGSIPDNYFKKKRVNKNDLIESWGVIINTLKEFVN